MLNDIPVVWVQLVQFFLNILILGGVGIWRLAQAERDITSKFDKNVDVHRREVMIEMSNLREKQIEIERWVLEQFVRREDLKSTIDQINVTLSELRQRLDVRMDRIENKIDSLGILKK